VLIELRVAHREKPLVSQPQLSDPPLLPRWLTWSHCALLALLLVLWGNLFLHATFSEYAASRDFLGIYLGAKLVATGHSSQLYDLGAQRQVMDDAISPHHRHHLMSFVYPAYVALLFSPMGRLSLSAAFLLWTGIDVLIAVLTCVFLLRLDPRPVRSQFALLAFVLAWIPLHLTILHGQLGLLPAIGFIGVILSLRNKQQVRAGFWLALGVLKPQLILYPLIALTFERRWRTLVSFFAALSILVALPFVKFGFWLPRYFAFLGEYNGLAEQASLYPSAMQNWRGLMFALLKTDSSSVSRALILALALGSLVLLSWVCAVTKLERSNSPRPDCVENPAWERCFAIAVLLGALSSPHLYLHDWVVALPAMGILLSGTHTCKSRRPLRSLMLLVGCAPFVVFVGQFNLLPTLGFIRWVPCYMAMIVLMAVRDLAQARRAPAGTFFDHT
jgi:hypothetical protein